MKKIILFFLLFLVIGTAIFFMVRKDKSELEIMGTDIAEITDIKSYLAEVGKIVPQVGALIKIGARTTGVIEHMAVDVGDKVKKDQVIATIDNRQLNEQIKQNRSDIEILKNKIDEEEMLYPIKKKIKLEEIKYAESKQIEAKGKYEREEQLYNKGFSSDEELEAYISDYKNAEYSLNRAKLELIDIEKTHIITLNDYKYNMGKQISIAEELNIQLSYSNIIAPIDGIVTQVAAQEGETIVSGLQVSELINVLNPELLELWIYIDETDIGIVNEGMDVEFTVDTYTDKKFHGLIEHIYLEPEIQEGIVYYKAILDISKEDVSLLKPEMTAHVRIITKKKKNVLTIKNGAIKWDKDHNVVYKVLDKANNKTEKIEVKMGIRGGERTEILEGLEEGDVVATKIILPVSK